MQVAMLLVPLGAGVASGACQKRARSAARFPVVSLAVLLLTAAMLALQLRFPGLLPALARETAMLENGQLWRAVTALFVQDGGLAGGLFNLTLLLALGLVAERVLGSRQWLAVYLGGGILTEFLALAWQPHGAGNSIACFALAGALVAHGLAGRPRWLSVGVSLIGLIGGLALLAARDIHGIGLFAGVAIGALFVWRDRQNIGS